MKESKFVCFILFSFFYSSLAFHSTPSGKLARQIKMSRLAATTVEKTEAEWREVLTPDQFYVLREEGTEAPNTSSLLNVKEPGTFTCAGCGTPLFTTEAKYESGTGWPSFYSPIDKSSVALSTDFKLILPRTECSCSVCDGHLGHVFNDGPEPTGQRFCMNSASLKIEPFSDDE